MSDATFEQMYKEVLLHAPDTPLPLAKKWVNKSYLKALSHGRWSELVEEDSFAIAAPYTTGTVSVTLGSTSVTGSGTVWTSAMEGRQFIVPG